MSRVSKLKVGKARTLRPSSEDEEWLKESYELEIEIDNPEDVEKASQDASRLIDGWLFGKTKTPAQPSQQSQSSPQPQSTPQLPQLDPDELEKLPWKTYKTKEAAKPGEAAWIMRETKGAEALADLIEKQGKDIPVQIGSQKYTMRFSGDKQQFIGRAPLKKAESSA